MVDEEGAGNGGLLGRIEAALEGSQQACNIAVQVADLAGDGANEFGLVGRQMG